MLRGDRHIVTTDISLACNDVVEAGQVLVYGNSGSGSVQGDTAGTAALKANPSGFVPAGLALTNVVSIDQTRFHRNFQKTDQVLGERVALLRDGWVVTDKVLGSPTPGAPAYLGASGLATPTLANATATPKVGEFMGLADQFGFAKLYVKLPA